MVLYVGILKFIIIHWYWLICHLWVSFRLCVKQVFVQNHLIYDVGLPQQIEVIFIRDVCTNFKINFETKAQERSEIVYWYHEEKLGIDQ